MWILDKRTYSHQILGVTTDRVELDASIANEFVENIVSSQAHSMAVLLEGSTKS